MPQSRNVENVLSSIITPGSVHERKHKSRKDHKHSFVSHGSPEEIVRVCEGNSCAPRLYT